jgi:hypothetical protein
MDRGTVQEAIVACSLPPFGAGVLGHSNLSTTSRCLNIRRRGLHLAMQKPEESRAVAQALHKAGERPLAVVQDTPASSSSKPTVQ